MKKMTEFAAELPITFKILSWVVYRYQVENKFSLEENYNWKQIRTGIFRHCSATHPGLIIINCNWREEYKCYPSLTINTKISKTNCNPPVKITQEFRQQETLNGSCFVLLQ